MAQADDLKAIDDYIRRSQAVTPQQQQIQRDWNTWYNGLSLWAKSISGDTLPEAKRRKDLFNSARSYPLAPAKANDAPIVPVTAGPKPVLRKGAGRGNLASQKPYVQEWQRIIGFTGSNVDGDFWTMTHDRTKQWQKERQLTVDGIVGPQSWTRAAQDAKLAAVRPQSIAQAAKQAVLAVNAQAAKPAPKPAAQKSASKPVQKPAPAPTAQIAQQAANLVTGATTASRPPVKPPVTPAPTTVKEKAKVAIDKTKATVSATAAQAQATIYEMPLWLKVVGGGALAIGGFKLGSAAVKRAAR